MQYSILSALLVFGLILSSCGTTIVDSGSNGSSSSYGGGGASSSGGKLGSQYIFEDFAGSGIPTGWMYSGFSRRTSDGVGNSASLGANFDSYNTSASITTSSVAMGAKPVLSFKYKATDRVCCYGPSSTPATANAVKYTVRISEDDGSTWANILENEPNVLSADFNMIIVSSSVLNVYLNRIIKVQIMFTRVTDTYILLDDIAIGTVPPIFSGAVTLNAGNVYNNYSTPLDANTRIYSIANKGSQPLTLSTGSTTGGITVTDLPNTLPEFSTETITLLINASGFATYAVYSGSFSLITNDPDRPTVTINITGPVEGVRKAPEGEFQDFSGTGTPAGWTYSGFSRRTSDGVDNSASLGANFDSYNTSASVTTSYVATGTNSVLSFKYRATDRVCCYGPSSTPAAVNVVKYTVEVSKDDGATWTNVLEDEPNVSSDDFTAVTAGLPVTYANQVVWTRITFRRVTDVYVLLDDVAIDSEVN